MKNFLSIVLMFLLCSCTAVQSADMRFVQVEGVLYSPADKNSVTSFQKLINDINNQKNVEFVVFTGNNIAKPNKTYLEDFVKEAKKLKAPFYVVLGNKDVNKQKAMGKSDYAEILKKKVKTHRKINSTNYAFVKKGIAFVVVDGAKEIIPSTIGYYKDDTLDWVEDTLTKYQDKKVVILQHFPLIPPSKKELYYTYKAEDYLKLLKVHKNVKAIISGHFGVNSEQEYDEILHITTANVPEYRIIDIIDYDTDNPTFWSTIKK